MQFIKKGPDIPERLLQLHEDGKVVFFCGAGISKPAKLPGFKGLVNQLYDKMGVERDKIQREAIRSRKFDTAIRLLETHGMGRRETVLKNLAKILTPKWDDLPANATATHKALLTLGNTREGKMRLITTNFDRIFEKVIQEESKKGSRKKSDYYQAPHPPAAKKYWNGLVYLHGLLPPEPNGEMDHLVISSSDFGRAYLIESWAARFTIELFRNYTVCFVGYSINDPILRYMMDALATDHLRGEVYPEIFAFGSYSKGKKEEQEYQWKTKNVTPILYKEHNKHSYLHETLHVWSQYYRDGKASIVESLAERDPVLSTEEDNYVGRMLWALSDPKGEPAKRFAEFNPVPRLDWLKSLSKNHYQHKGLDRFGVPKKPAYHDELEFSFVKRPAPYDKAPLMALVNQGSSNSEWDDVMGHLGCWLVRHLGDPKLVLWVADQGGCLHYKFKELIQEKLNELDKLEKHKNRKEIKQIRKNAPKSIPDPLMRTLWELILSGRLKQFSDRHDRKLSRWFDRFNLKGLTPSLRMELREFLTPHVKIGDPSHLGDRKSETNTPQHISDLVRSDIVLSVGRVHDTLKRKKDDANWKSALPVLLGDFNLLLLDAFNLMRLLGKAEDFYDQSHSYQPSISEHSQNRTFRDWTALIDLTRDAWLATAEKNIGQARLVAEEWWETPYPLFKRLAFFAATERNDVISHQQALKWLLADDNRWFWSVEVQREMMRLLVTLGPLLGDAEMKQLEKVILGGPPPKMFRKNIENERRAIISDQDIWLRLARLQAGDVKLSDKALLKLESLKKKYRWSLREDERDDFPTWFSSGISSKADFLPTPQGKDELIEWLCQHYDENIKISDDWGERCETDFKITSDALIDLTKKDKWLAKWWGRALLVWTEGDLLEHSWKIIPKIIIKSPDDFIQAISRELGCWLEEQASKIEGQEKLFFRLIERILKLKHQAPERRDNAPPSHVINYSVGLCTEALLKRFCHSLKNGQGLPNKYKSLFTKICDTEGEYSRRDRAILATYVIALFLIDKKWTSNHLLPLFDWQKPEAEVRAVWAGFLDSPEFYIHWPLMVAIKGPFFEAAKHYEKLGRYSKKYTSLLVLAAMEQDNTPFTKKELSDATCALPQKGIVNVIGQLTQTFDGTKKQRADHWKNRVLPYLQSIWHRLNRDRAPDVSAELAHLCVAAQDGFPDAYNKMFKGELQSLEDRKAYSIVQELHEANLSKQFPKEALAFLDTIIGDKCRFIPPELSDCLNAIRKNMRKGIEKDWKFQRLSELSQINQ